jgi:hypothetical protein
MSSAGGGIRCPNLSNPDRLYDEHLEELKKEAAGNG